MNTRQPNQLLAALYALQAQQAPPQNMLAGLEQDFDPNSIVGRLLAQQRAEAEKAQKAPPKPPPPRGALGLENAESVLQRRLREAGLE